uniref:Uncharacterized protein n=1 Tax=Arundo donax TaxID=35708 RepID=A0A0A8XNI4_ARUDO
MKARFCIILLLHAMLYLIVQRTVMISKEALMSTAFRLNRKQPSYLMLCPTCRTDSLLNIMSWNL